MTKTLSELKADHVRKYGAPIGKRKCDKKYSPTCLGVAKEALFRWRTCLECRKLQMHDWHAKRVNARGGPQKRGRKPLSPELKKERESPRKKSNSSGGKARKQQKKSSTSKKGRT